MSTKLIRILKVLLFLIIDCMFLTQWSTDSIRVFVYDAKRVMCSKSKTEILILKSRCEELLHLYYADPRTV